MSSTDLRPSAPGPGAAEAHRLEALDRSGLLSDDVSEPFHRVSRFARQLLGVDTAMVSLIDDHQQLFKGHDGLRADLAERGRSSLSHSYCKFPVATGERLVVPDARDSALLSESPAIADHDAVAYVGVPLALDEGSVLGTLCVFNATPRSWTPQDVSTLEELAAVVLAEIEHRVRRQELEQVAALTTRLEDPVDKLGDVTRTITHLIEEPGADPRLPRLGDVARSRMRTVEVLTHDLVNTAKAVRRPPGPRTVDLRDLLSRAADLVLSTARADDLRMELPDEPVVVPFPPGPTSRALNLVVVAALRYARPGHRVAVSLVADDDAARVSLRAPSATVPTAELLRIAGQFRGPDDEELTANVSARAGGSRVQNAVLTATSGRDGASFEVRLPRTSDANRRSGHVLAAQRDEVGSTPR